MKMTKYIVVDHFVVPKHFYLHSVWHQNHKARARGGGMKERTEGG
jgi:hypothetical protein